MHSVFKMILFITLKLYLRLVSGFFSGLLTRNSSSDLMDYKNTPAQHKKQIFDAITVSSIISNCTGVDTSKSQVITLANFTKFLETKQMEQRTEDQVRELIQVHNFFLCFKYH